MLKNTLMGVCVVSLILFPFLSAEASIFTKISGFFVSDTQADELPTINPPVIDALEVKNSSTEDLLPVDHNALAVPVDPSAFQKHSPIISTYVVRKGDTLADIAKMFDVSVNTVLWSNNLTKKDTIKEGQTLVILPVSGVSHIVKKGDTIASIVKKYGADQAETLSFNGLTDNNDLVVGQTIIIPDGEIKAVATTKTPSKTGNPFKTGGSNGVIIAVGNKQLDPEGYFIRPVASAVRTQGIHGYNGIDLANKIGTPILAAADGTVVVSRSSGWNGGYGNYIVISHSNGMQTLYGHLSEVSVGVGDTVTQGQVIGKMGISGKATGSHLHFEVRGGKNPF